MRQTDEITLTIKELKDLLIRAGRLGFNSYEPNEAGLEHYDAEAEASWVILTLLNNKHSKENGRGK